MAELHILGELTGASGVDAAGLSCRWKFVTDTSASDSEYWLQLEGEAQGVTQMALISSADELAVWGHPLDVHYSFTALRGWPKLHVELWRQDTFGRAEVCASLPSYSAAVSRARGSELAAIAHTTTLLFRISLRRLRLLPRANGAGGVRC